MNKTFEMTLLFDFFGDLLTGKQREYFDYYYNDDLSLGEISELTGVSRQGVRDTLLRSERLLMEYEEKTGVVKRFRELDSALRELEVLAGELEAEVTGPALEKARLLRAKLRGLL